MRGVRGVHPIAIEGEHKVIEFAEKAKVLTRTVMEKENVSDMNQKTRFETLYRVFM